MVYRSIIAEQEYKCSVQCWTDSWLQLLTVFKSVDFFALFLNNFGCFRGGIAMVSA